MGTHDLVGVTRGEVDQIIAKNRIGSPTLKKKVSVDRNLLEDISKFMLAYQYDLKPKKRTSTAINALIEIGLRVSK